MKLFKHIKHYILGKDISSRLSIEKLNLVEEFYETDFRNVGFTSGGLLQKIIPWNYAAIVFVNTINYRIGYEWLINDDLTLAEELWHVTQWRKYGFIKLPIGYLVELRKNGYEGNAYEKEAKQKARDYLNYKIKRKMRA
jgi:hypothetical protein